MVYLRFGWRWNGDGVDDGAYFEAIADPFAESVGRGEEVALGVAKVVGSDGDALTSETIARTSYRGKTGNRSPVEEHAVGGGGGDGDVKVVVVGSDVLFVVRVGVAVVDGEPGFAYPSVDGIERDGGGVAKGAPVVIAPGVETGVGGLGGGDECRLGGGGHGVGVGLSGGERCHYRTIDFHRAVVGRRGDQDDIAFGRLSPLHRTSRT